MWRQTLTYKAYILLPKNIILIFPKDFQVFVENVDVSLLPLPALSRQWQPLQFQIPFQLSFESRAENMEFSFHRIRPQILVCIDTWIFSFFSESSLLVEVWPGSSNAGAVSPIFAVVSPSIHAHKLAWDIAHVCIDYLRFICDRKVTTPNYFKIVQKHSLCLVSSIFDIRKFKYPIIHLRASSGQVFLQLQIYLSLAEKDILKENRVWLNGDMVTFLAKKTWQVQVQVLKSWSRASFKWQ